MKYITNIIRILFFALFLFLLANGKVMLWLALFVVSLFLALIFGRIYCGYVCPMNTLMILTQWLSKKLKIKTLSAPRWLKNGYFSWITLVISVATMLISKKLFHINLPIMLFWLIISVLFTLRYKPSVFHNLICPFGALQRTFGKLTLFSKSVNKDLCIGCRLCENVCTMDAISVIGKDKKAVINPALCYQCNNCQKICPKSAIHYRKK
jgi:polyferredoxin